MKKLGTIVHLKNKKQKLMIIARGIVVKEKNEEQLYDYIACLYPQGYDESNLYYFNERHIEKIVSEGYSDEDEERFIQIYKDILNNNRKIVI